MGIWFCYWQLLLCCLSSGKGHGQVKVILSHSTVPVLFGSVAPLEGSCISIYIIWYIICVFPPSTANQILSYINIYIIIYILVNVYIYICIYGNHILEAWGPLGFGLEDPKDRSSRTSAFGEPKRRSCSQVVAQPSHMHRVPWIHTHIYICVHGVHIYIYTNICIYYVIYNIYIYNIIWYI